MTVEQVLEAVNDRRRHDNELVVITGGEPMRQEAIVHLCQGLLIGGYRVQIETAGTMWQENLPGAVHIVVSPKGTHVHAEIAKRASCWKYVIRKGETLEDGLPCMKNSRGDISKTARPPKGTHPSNVYLSPCDEHDEPKTKANYRLVAKLSQKHGYRAMLQIHKLLEVE